MVKNDEKVENWSKVEPNFEEIRPNENPQKNPNLAKKSPKKDEKTVEKVPNLKLPKIPQKILKLPSKNVGQKVENWPENRGKTDLEIDEKTPILSEKIDPISTIKYTDNIWVKSDLGLDRVSVRAEQSGGGITGGGLFVQNKVTLFRIKILITFFSPIVE